MSTFVELWLVYAYPFRFLRMHKETQTNYNFECYQIEELCVFFLRKFLRLSLYFVVYAWHNDIFDNLLCWLSRVKSRWQFWLIKLLKSWWFFPCNETFCYSVFFFIQVQIFESNRAVSQFSERLNPVFHLGHIDSASRQPPIRRWKRGEASDQPAAVSLDLHKISLHISLSNIKTELQVYLSDMISFSQSARFRWNVSVLCYGEKYVWMGISSSNTYANWMWLLKL